MNKRVAMTQANQLAALAWSIVREMMLTDSGTVKRIQMLLEKVRECAHELEQALVN